MPSIPDKPRRGDTMSQSAALFTRLVMKVAVLEHSRALMPASVSRWREMETRENQENKLVAVRALRSRRESLKPLDEECAVQYEKNLALAADVAYAQ